MSTKTVQEQTIIASAHHIVIAALLGALLFGHEVEASDPVSTIDPTAVESHRQTSLGLYLTSADAHQALTQDPSILFIDVRTTAEFGLVGHPTAVDRNIPFAHLSNVVDANFGQYRFRRNPQFVSQVREFVKNASGSENSTIFLICRSGSRSKHSADLLAEAGFTRVWNIVEGFEGTMGASGSRDIEGWRHDNLPWTYTIRPDQAFRAAP